MLENIYLLWLVVKRARNSIIVRHNDPRISRTNLWYLSGVAKTEVNDRAK